MSEQMTSAKRSMSSNGIEIGVISESVQRKLDRAEDDVIAVEEAFRAIVDAHDGLRRRSLTEQIETIRAAEEKLTAMKGIPGAIQEELRQQMQKYSMVQGAMMDEAEFELRCQWHSYLEANRKQPSRIRRWFSREDDQS